VSRADQRRAPRERARHELIHGRDGGGRIAERERRLDDLHDALFASRKKRRKAEADRRRTLGRSRSLRDRLTVDLQRDIKDVIGITARVVVQGPGTLERSAGKAKRVVDKRNLT